MNLPNCVHCNQPVQSHPEEMGPEAKTIPLATKDGDFGCDDSPETTEDGVGCHLAWMD